MTSLDANRRFLELNVKEVSLVDDPANEVRLCVVKSKRPPEEVNVNTTTQAAVDHNGETRADEESTVSKSAQQSNDTEEVSLTVTKSVEDKGAELLSVLETLVEKAKAKVADVSTEATEKAVPPKLKAYMEGLKKSGMKDEDVKKAVDTAKASGLFETEKAADAAVTKSAQAQVQAAEGTVSALDELLAAVQKGKTFTPSRMEALKSVAQTLKGLLEELESGSVGKAGIPSAEEMANQTSLPKGKGLPGGLSEMTGVTKALEDVTTVLKSVVGRVEAIESTRQPSKSVEGDGGTDKKEPVQKSFWSGVL